MIYRPEDGLILSTIIGPGRDYGPDVLDKHGQTWLFIEGCTSLDPTTCYVDIATKAIVPFAPITIAADKIEFFAGNADAARLSGLPIGSNIAVFCDGSVLTNSVSTDGALTITSANPATFEIRVFCHRYLPTSITIRAIDPPPLVWTMSTSLGGTLEQPVA